MSSIETKSRSADLQTPRLEDILSSTGPSLNRGEFLDNTRLQRAEVGNCTLQTTASHADRVRTLEAAVQSWRQTTGIIEMTVDPAAASPGDHGATDKLHNMMIDSVVESFKATFEGYANSNTGRSFIQRLNSVGTEVRFERDGREGSNMAFEPMIGGGWVKINTSLVGAAGSGEQAFMLAEEISHMTIGGRGSLEEVVAKVNATYAANRIGQESGSFSHTVRSVDDIIGDVRLNYNNGRVLGDGTEEKMRAMIDDLRREGMNFIPPEVEQELYQKAAGI